MRAAARQISRPRPYAVVMQMRGSETAALRELLEVAFARDPGEVGALIALCRIVGEVEFTRLPLDAAQTKIASAAVLAAKLSVPAVFRLRQDEPYPILAFVAAG